MTEYPVHYELKNGEVSGFTIDSPASDLIKFRWARAKRPESDLPYV